MKIDFLLPHEEISLKKYERLYKGDRAFLEAEKDRKAVRQAYFITFSLFFLSLCLISYGIAKGGRETKDVVILILLFIGLFIFIYRTRYGRADKLIKKRKEEIIDDLPEFIHKVVLLLNTGMVTESVLVKIALDYKNAAYATDKKPLYEGLWEVAERTERSNSPFIRELCSFAGRSGVHQLMRFCAILEDNYTKGSTLADKLEGEGALLWQDRKKRAEEKAKLAETKLAMPLMLLLLSLILITTSPMLLSMQ
jgi:tight adherence protein C